MFLSSDQANVMKNLEIKHIFRKFSFEYLN